MTLNKYPRSAICIFVWLGIVLATVSSASAGWKEKVLYSFQGYPDGATPVGGVVFDKHGNLYGAAGGGSDSCPSTGDCGVVYQLSPSKQQAGAWIESVLYTFKGYNQGDGATPGGGLILDAAGNLYGVTAYGGTGNCAVLGTTMGCGSVFRLTPPKTKGGAWTEKVLYSFQGDKDGQFPVGDLVFDQIGNLYGATYFGGGFGSCDEPYYHHCGTVFELIAPKTKDGKWKENVRYSFKSGKDGANPNGGLVLDSTGTIYGTTYIGGYNCPHNSGRGCGTVFELKPPTNQGGVWVETVLHRFKASTDGANPAAGMTLHGKGYLYGTSDAAIFRMTPPKTGSGAWRQAILYALDNNAYDPAGALIFDQSGNLYGTTQYGNGRTLQGSVFQLEPPKGKGDPWIFIALHGFLGTPDGEFPAASLVFDNAGNFYSTTRGGGNGSCGCGTVFAVSP